MGHVLDGVAEHMSNYDDDYTFIVSDDESVDIVEVLKESDGRKTGISYGRAFFPSTQTLLPSYRSFR